MKLSSSEGFERSRLMKPLGFGWHQPQPPMVEELLRPASKHANAVWQPTRPTSAPKQLAVRGTAESLPSARFGNGETNLGAGAHRSLLVSAEPTMFVETTILTPRSKVFAQVLSVVAQSKEGNVSNPSPPPLDAPPRELRSAWAAMNCTNAVEQQLNEQAGPHHRERSIEAWNEDDGGPINSFPLWKPTHSFAASLSPVVVAANASLKKAIHLLSHRERLEYLREAAAHRQSFLVASRDVPHAAGGAPTAIAVPASGSATAGVASRPSAAALRLITPNQRRLRQLRNEQRAAPQRELPLRSDDSNPSAASNHHSLANVASSTRFERRVASLSRPGSSSPTSVRGELHRPGTIRKGTTVHSFGKSREPAGVAASPGSLSSCCASAQLRAQQVASEYTRRRMKEREEETRQRRVALQLSEIEKLNDLEAALAEHSTRAVLLLRDRVSPRVSATSPCRNEGRSPVVLLSSVATAVAPPSGKQGAS